MVDDFINGFVVKSGQKYIKIMSGNGGSAFMLGFIVKDDTKYGQNLKRVTS